MIRREDDTPPPITAEPAPVETAAGPALPVDSEPALEVEHHPDTRAQTIGRAAFQVLLGLAILAAAGLATWLLVQQKTMPASVPTGRAAPAVVTSPASVQTLAVQVSGHGTARATRQLQLAPQVGGRVVEVHPDLVSGGTFAGGEVVLRVDPTDYELALEQAQADVERAEAGLARLESRRRAAAAEVARRRTALQTAEAEAEVARREFERLNPGQEVPPLVAREPQRLEAVAALEAAQAALEDVASEERELLAQQRQARAALRMAQVNLDRTALRLPEGPGRWRVTSQSVASGQAVQAGQVVAQMYDAGSLEVPVPLEDRDLEWLEIAQESPGRGSEAVIRANQAGQRLEWSGRAQRTEASIDPRTRLVQVVVVLDESPGDPPVTLRPGTFVEVQFTGRTLEDVSQIPRQALHENHRTGGPVVQVEKDGLLRTVPVEIVRRERDALWVRGLEDGAEVILTHLDLATDGMAVTAMPQREQEGL